MQLCLLYHIYLWRDIIWTLRWAVLHTTVSLKLHVHWPKIGQNWPISQSADRFWEFRFSADLQYYIYNNYFLYFFLTNDRPLDSSNLGSPLKSKIKHNLGPIFTTKNYSNSSQSESHLLHVCWSIGGLPTIFSVVYPVHHRHYRTTSIPQQQ